MLKEVLTHVSADRDRRQGPRRAPSSTPVVRGSAGKTIPWSVIRAQADNGFRLVNQAKGIYKPHYTEYALSVRQTLDGPYADKDVEWRPDGS
jgi:hypothetical protein